jgi:hypothetical protein
VKRRFAGELAGGRVLEILRFTWNATKGYRLTPWRSPYLRWRVETYSGKRAETLKIGDFWHLFWSEKRQFLRFLGWTREMRGYAVERERQ